jgi:hypothetical protein
MQLYIENIMLHINHLKHFNVRFENTIITPTVDVQAVRYHHSTLNNEALRVP